MKKRKISFTLSILLSAFLLTSLASLGDRSGKTQKIENPSFPISEEIFNVIPKIVLHYNIPSDPKSGLKYIEGLDPTTNSKIFLLEFDIPSQKSKFKTQRFYSPSGILLLRSRLKDGNINFQLDFLGDKSISVRDTKISMKESEFRIFLEDKKMFNTIFQYDINGQLNLSLQTKENMIKQLTTFLEKIRGSTFERQLKEFAWAHSFMPKNDSTFAAIFAGILTGIVSIPNQISVQSSEDEDSPFWRYTLCLESSCWDCGGTWTISPVTGCACLGTWAFLCNPCYGAQSIVCFHKHLILPL